MLPGPVFSLELITSSRRARYFAARSAFGLILLLLLAISYDDMTRVATSRASLVTGRRLAAFAHDTFQVLSVAQVVAILILTPALFAGAIVEEKRRRTLLYLMSSSLNSAEIITGKLGARFLHVLAAIAIGFPIFSFLTLLGGVSPVLVIGIGLISTSTAFLLATFSMLVSVHSRRVGSALLVVFLVEVVWLLGLSLADPLFRWFWPDQPSWLTAALDWGWFTSPLGVWWNFSRITDTGEVLHEAVIIASVHGLVGLALLGIAIARLRPVFRAEATEHRAVENRGSERRQPDDRDGRTLDRFPMLWKETRHTSRGRLALIGWRAGIAMTVGLLLYWGLRLGIPAARELSIHGYARAQPAREVYNTFVRVSGGFLSILWVLGLAATSAACITTERESETWVSLRTTLLEPFEILLGKLLGTLWKMRFLGGCMVVTWASGLALGAVHPIGFLAVLSAWVVYTAFPLALGCLLSIHARTTLRATVLTLVIVMFCNGGYMLLCAPSLVDFPLLGAGCMPAIVALSPLTYGEFEGMLRNLGSQGLILTDEALTFLISLVGYGAASLTLILAARMSLGEGSVDRRRQVTTTSLHPRPPVSGSSPAAQARG